MNESVPFLPADQFRQALANLADPARTVSGLAEPEAVKRSAIEALLIARRLFNRKKLNILHVWTKLFAATEAALASAGADDTTVFVSRLLGGVLAEPNRVATDPDLAAWLADCGTDGAKDAVFRTSLLRLVRQQLPILPALVRRRYEEWRQLNPGRAAEDDAAETGEDDDDEEDDKPSPPRPRPEPTPSLFPIDLREIDDE